MFDVEVNFPFKWVSVHICVVRIQILVLFAEFDWIATSSIYSLFWTVVSNLNFLSENMRSFILRIYIKTDKKLMEDLD